MKVSRREFLYFSTVNLLLSKSGVNKSKVNENYKRIRGRKIPHIQTNEPKEETKITKLCIIHNSGQILLAENESIVRSPASLVKLMLMYLVSEKIIRKEISLNMVIKPKRTIFPTNHSDIAIFNQREYLLDELIKAMAVISSNTSALTIAESLWGDIEKCVTEMNATARKLGMNNTLFNTVNGFPVKPGVDVDKTTGMDMGVLAIECCKSPTILRWTSTKEFPIPGEHIIRKNTNHLLFKFDGCDGLKTGYTRSAGHCLIATAKKANKRVISVVMGAKTSRERFTIAENLLEIGFAEG